jgi:serine/threonine protein kinase
VQLKSGSFATVCRGTHRASGKKVAIKCVLRKDLPPTDDAAIYDEVAIMSSLSHPHIVPLIDFFEEKDCYFLVMELMSGGDLFDRIGKKKSYSEADARDLAIKMLKAMAYCHSHSIAHCDMKPKNLLLMSEDNDSYIKLADFGFAARCHIPKSLTKQCGTPFFVSPEILMRQPYDQQSDMWSVGCIIFLLLSGNLPFMGRSQKELFRKIVSGKFEFDEDDWCDVSNDAKDLVQKLLVLDPDERLTSSQALKHKWMKVDEGRLSKMALQGTSQRLKTFNARMKLRSALIAVDWVNQLKRSSWMSNRRVREDD